MIRSFIAEFYLLLTLLDYLYSLLRLSYRQFGKLHSWPTWSERKSYLPNEAIKWVWLGGKYLMLVHPNISNKMEEKNIAE